MKFVFVILLLLLCNIPEIKNYQVMRFDRFEVCGQSKNSTFSVDYLEIHHVKHGSIIAAKFKLTEDFKKVKLEIDLSRCANKEDMNSCEKYPKLKIPNGCQLMGSKKTMLTPMFYAFTPPFICPFKKGEFIAKNATYDPNMMQLIPMENYYWKIKAKYIDGETNDYVFDLCINGQATKN